MSEKKAFSQLTKKQQAAAVEKFPAGDPGEYVYEIGEEGEVLWRTHSPARNQPKKNQQVAADWEQLKLF